MNKTIVYCLLLLAPFLSQSQTKTYTGVVKDISTMLPVELVSISVEGSNLGSISNEEGLFRLTLPNDVKVLKFNHLNYNLYTYTIDTEKAEFEIYLEPKVFTLDEIIVSTKPLDDFLVDILKASKKKMEKSILMNTYYREFVNINGKYTTFADGILDYNIKKQNGKSDVYVKQSRAFKLNDPIMAKKQENADGVTAFDVRDAMEDAYNFKIMKSGLSSKRYDYTLRNKTDSKGNSIRIIKIEPKESVHEDLFEGSVTYDAKSNLILEIDFKKAPSHQKYSKEINVLIFRFTLYEFTKKCSFKIDGDKYIMTYSQNKMAFHVKMGKQFNDDFEFLSDVVTLDYKDGEFELDRDKRYREKSLYKAGNNFTSEFWKTSNIMLLNEAEERILESLK